MAVSAGCYLYFTWRRPEEMLKKDYVRDGNRISGRTNERFHTTRDVRGNLVSINSAGAGLLIGRKK
jgi:hypothetical protein